MRKVYIGVLAAIGAAVSSAFACSSDPASESQHEEGTELGSAEVALTNVPSNVKCVALSVQNEARTVNKSYSVEETDKAVFSLQGLPVGRVSFNADAYDVSCNKVNDAVMPSWVSQPVTVRLIAGIVKNVALLMVQNGKAAVSVDFDDSRSSPSDPEAPGCTGTSSSDPQPHLVPLVPGVTTRPILTVGDSPNLKPDGVTPYRLVGIPDGMGAFDNGDDTFTLLVNHELGQGSGVVRAHGATGAFVSKHVICKDNLQVVESSDLIQQHVLWIPGSGYAAPSTGNAFGRFCAADLPEETAFFDVESGLGYDGRLFMNGEEIGAEGRAFAHALDGISYELPRLGKFSWENSVANPKPGATTVVAGMDDSGGGQVYIYYGSKTASGSPVEMAGLANGNLYGLRVPGVPSEPAAGLAGAMPFELYNHGNVENMTGAALDDASGDNDVTAWNRPEDGHWDPNNPNHYYWVTTASFSGSTRLWVLRFNDVSDPTAGGEIEMLIDGATEGGKMFDNMTMDRFGHVYLQEDVGNNVHNGTVWRYDVATDGLTAVLEHHRPYYLAGVDPAAFITQDEESSGVIDVSDILGPGHLLLNVQAHRNVGGELVQLGQILHMYDPAAAGL